MILAVALSPSVDITYLVDDLVEGAQTRPISVHRVAGGKAINAARTAAALGHEVRVVAPLAGPTGTLVVEGLASAGIPARLTPADADTRSCVSIFSMRSHLLTELYERAPSLAEAWPALTASIREELRRDRVPGWMLVSGSIPDCGVADPIAELAAIAREVGVPLAIDTHGVALNRALGVSPAILKVNRSEAAGVLGHNADAQTLARRLQARTGGLVIVTDGEAGSVAVGSDGGWSVRLDGVRGDFPVGSGDAYLGALLAALDNGEPLSDALRLAAAAGAANSLEPGAAVFRPEDVSRLREAVELSPIS